VDEPTRYRCGRGAGYLEWAWHPDPADTTTRTEFVLLLRQSDGSVHLVHETHQFGLFARQVWLRTLTDVGFEPQVVMEKTTEERMPREFFIGHRPRGDLP
jgi:hypothetical protein